MQHFPVSLTEPPPACPDVPGLSWARKSVLPPHACIPTHTKREKERAKRTKEKRKSEGVERETYGHIPDNSQASYE